MATAFRSAMDAIRKSDDAAPVRDRDPLETAPQTPEVSDLLGLSTRAPRLEQEQLKLKIRAHMVS